MKFDFFRVQISSKGEKHLKWRTEALSPQIYSIWYFLFTKRFGSDTLSRRLNSERLYAVVPNADSRGLHKAQNFGSSSDLPCEIPGSITKWNTKTGFRSAWDRQTAEAILTGPHFLTKYASIYYISFHGAG